MENLKLKHTASRYGGKRRNFVTSRFAFSKVTALVDSKSIKYNVDVKKVNPAYTSQMGKLLFVKKYGLTIHEAASIAIGRRALGYTDRLPDVIRAMLPKEKQELEGLDLWKAAYPVTKKMQAKDMYGYRFCTYSAC